MNTMEVNAQQPQKKKSKLKDVPVTVYRIIEVPPNIEGVRKTATIQIVPESEFDDETSDPSGSDDPDKVNVTVTSFVIDDDNMVKQHSTSKIIRLPVPIQCRRQHSIFNEAIEADVNDGNSDLLGRNYSCAICMKTFKHGSHLKRHVNTHTGERIYKCDLCDKTFLDASTLSRHRKIHSGDKPWSCKICKKSFGTLGSLRRHITVHNQEGRPYQCETCKKRFPDNSSYQKHKFIHTGIKPYGCDICGKAFVHIGDLNGHRKIHVEVKPYNCERCGKDFAKHSNYARHLLIHEGDKEFLCTICGVSYNFQSSLTRHLLTHVRKNTNASAEVSSVNDKNIDLVSQGKHSSLDNDDLATETTERKVVSNVNKIKVTRTKMKHFRKIKQLHRFQDHTRIEKPDKLPSLSVSNLPQPPEAPESEPTVPVTEDIIVPDLIDPTVLPPQDEFISKQTRIEKPDKLPSLSVSNLPQPPEAPESEPTVPVTEDIIVPDLIDPTVLPPQDEFISKQTTTEDVTALLSSVDDFGSTKDIAQALLQLTPHPVYGTSSGSVISLFSDSSGSEYVLSTTKSGETGSDVQTSGNNGAVISDSDSVITIISVSDDPVMSVGSIAANTSVSDSSELVVTVLEPIEADDTIAETSVSDIHNNIANNMKGASNRESSKQALTEVSDVEGKETLVLKKRGDISVSNGEERKTVGPKEGF